MAVVPFVMVVVPRVAAVVLACGLLIATCTPSAASPEFAGWVQALWPKAAKAGISAQTYAAAFDGVTPEFEILEKLDNQPEHEAALWDYLDGMVSEKRLRIGGEKLAELKPVLDAVEAFYGVPRQVIVAVWGIETTFGTDLGERNIIRSLATLGWRGGRRAKFGEQQLIAALKILEHGDVAPAGLKGSWAGAMGHTQFIPTTYNQYAVDFDHDGRRDIWTNLYDALGSAAHYLARSGWREGEPWGYEVILPAGFDYGLSGLSVRKPLAYWHDLGVTRRDGRPFGDLAMDGTVLLPVGAHGPAFMVFRNFRAILRYNSATAYALAVGQLADSLAGLSGPKVAWPRDQRPLRRAEREELQRLLAQNGYKIGTADGVIGRETRAALRHFQSARGLPADGFPSLQALEFLRTGR